MTSSKLVLCSDYNFASTSVRPSVRLTGMQSSRPELIDCMTVQLSARRMKTPMHRDARRAIHT